MTAKGNGRDKRQGKAPHQANKPTAGPDQNLIGTDQGSSHDNGGLQNPQSGGEEGRWDDLVQEYVREAVGEGFFVGDAVVHDSGWWEIDGKTLKSLRLVFVEGAPQPRQRKWVLDRIMPGLGSR